MRKHNTNKYKFAITILVTKLFIYKWNEIGIMTSRGEIIIVK